VGPLGRYMFVTKLSRREMLCRSLAGISLATLTPRTLRAGAADITISVELPVDRTKAGRLSLLDQNGKRIAGPWRVLGKADGLTAVRKGNPQRNPLTQYGDTPTGTYKVTGAFKVGDGTAYNKKSYGIHALRLDPTGGDAKQAKDLFGRTGLLIHSGDLGATGKLRPTNGCLRMSNDDIKALLDE
jgi:hypothetical protein